MKGSKKAIALAGILGIGVIGGTFAYFNQTLTAENVFDTGTYDSELVEKFSPSEGENWEPGANVNKDVTVKNSGSLPIVVRVSFKEEWTDKVSGETICQINTVDKLEKQAVATPANAQNKFENVYQGDSGDGVANETVDDSVVFKKLNPDGGWVYNPEDGYYYYQHVLAGVTKDEQGNIVHMDESSKLLDSVTLAEDVDFGAYDEIKYYATTEERPGDDDIAEDGDILGEGWRLFKTDGDTGAFVSTRDMNEAVKAAGGDGITYMRSVTRQREDAAGYSNANYTLTVIAQTVQTTEEAVNGQFGIKDLSVLTELGCDWKLTSENKAQED